MAAWTAPKINPSESLDIWRNFKTNKPLEILLEQIFEKEISRRNSLDGVTSLNVENRKGIVDGLKVAIGILKNQNLPE